MGFYSEYIFKKKRNYQKILVFRNSPKFIGLVKKKLSIKNKLLLKKIHLENKFLKYDLILVCGFDYSALSKIINFIKKNIIHPLNIIKKCSKNKTK